MVEFSIIARKWILNFSNSSMFSSLNRKYISWFLAVSRYDHKSTNLANGFAPVATDLTATPPVNQYTDIGHLGESAFYMVSVQQ